MNIEYIESKISDIVKELEKEVLEIVNNESLDRKQTNLRMKPLTSTKQILQNAIESIKMVDKVSKEDMQ